MARALPLALGVLAYVLFFVTFLYLVGFVGNLLVPRSVDVGPAAAPTLAVLIDVALLTIFGMQHSVMARPWFKVRWTRIVPPPLERAAYVVAASLALILLFTLWRPIPAVIWEVEGSAALALWGMFGLGWTVVFVSTHLINHWELFGLSQLWRHYRAAPEPPAHFHEPLFYRWVRHPLYLGFIIAFWATPVMTVGHALFAAGMTLYVLIAVGHEERDLVAAIGAPYADYRRRVGMLLPGIGRARD